VLDDQDAGPQERRVDRPLAGGGVIDVEGVDADERGASLDQRGRARVGQYG
jgi:hypothetical protein